jgi:hypothetical protein
MKSLFDSLLRLYEFDGPPAAVSSATAQKVSEEQLPDLSNQDASTFPYLP